MSQQPLFSSHVRRPHSNPRSLAAAALGTALWVSAECRRSSRDGADRHILVASLISPHSKSGAATSAGAQTHEFAARSGFLCFLALLASTGWATVALRRKRRLRLQDLEEGLPQAGLPPIRRLSKLSTLLLQTSGELRKGVKERWSLRSLTFPPQSEAYTANLIAGIIAGLKCVLGMVVFANIVFNSTGNPTISAMFATGININLMAAFIGVIWSTVFSGMNAIVTPQDVPALVLSQLAGTLADVVQDKAKAGHTLLAAGWLSTLLTGGILLVLGRLHAGGLLRKLPAPVIGGFIAAMGAIAIRGALTMLTGVPFHIFWPTDLHAFGDWKAWAHLGMAFITFLCTRYLAGIIKPHVKNDTARSLMGPCCMLSPLFVFYLCLFCRGRVAQDMSWLREMNWMYPTIEVKPFYTLWSETLRVDLVEWETLAEPSIAASLLVLAALTALSAMLSLVSCAPVVPCASDTKEGQLSGQVDIDQELATLGTSQTVVGGLTGMLPGYQQVGVSANMYLDGGTHRLSGFAAGFFILAVLVSGVPVSPYVPKFFLAANFFNVGVSFCKSHLVDNWGRMSAANYGCMLIIVFVGLAQGLTSAVAAGVVLEVVLMVQQSSAVDPVYQCGSSDGGFLSCRIRSMDEFAHLRWGVYRRADPPGPRLEVVRLQGPIFFGVAPTLEDEMEALFKGVPTLSHFILDMSRVTQVDDSGARALVSIVRKASQTGIKRIAMTGVRPVIGTELMIKDVAEDQTHSCLLRDSGHQAAELFPSLEDALEDYEDELLKEAHVTSDNPQAYQTEQYPCEAMSKEEWAIVKRAGSEVINLCPGELLNDFGDAVNGLWVLIRGRMACETMVADKSGGSSSGVGRVCKACEKYSAPVALGTSGFFLRTRMHAFRMRAYAPEGATVLWLKQADLDQLEAKNAAVYSKFITRFASYSLAVEGVLARWRSVD